MRRLRFGFGTRYNEPMWVEFAALLLGTGMFALGWFVRGFGMRPDEVPVHLTAHWRCPKCERVKELPAELESKVLVCNNCNVKLEKLGEAARAGGR